MHEELHPFLNAYMDGELRGARLEKMQAHLESCGICSHELEDLRRVSAALHGAPEPSFRPVEQFTADLALTLPQRISKERSSRVDLLIWWLIPAGLLFDWLLVNIVIFIKDAFFMAGASGLMGQTASASPTSGSQPLWFALLNLLTGGQIAVNSAINQLNELGGFTAGFLNGFMWQLGIGLVYMGWLAFWWFRRRPQTTNDSLRNAQQ